MPNLEKLDTFIEKLDVKAWDHQSPEERLALLQEFENIMAETEHREALHIHAISQEDYEKSPNTMGYFNGKDIYLNPRYLTAKNMIAGSVSSFSMAQALGTIAHEGRHAWQHYVIDHPELQMVDEKTRLLMQANFIGYYSPAEREDDPMILERHTLYEAQLIELDARRFQKQTIEYIARKLADKNGVPDRVFMHAERQCAARERSEAERLLHLFSETQLKEIERKFLEELIKHKEFGQIDISDFSVFDDAIRFLRSKDVHAFVEGKPVPKQGVYKDVKKMDGNTEWKAPEKPRIRYRSNKKKFR